MQITDFKEIAPFISGAVVAMATILAVIVTSLFNIKVAKINIEAQSRQKALELKIIKLEELYFLFEKWEIHLTKIYMLYLRCYKSKLEFIHVMEMVKEETLLAPGDAQKYKMLMNIHFPSLLSAYLPVDEARSNLVPFLTDPKESKLKAEDFIARHTIFNEACENFKKHLRTIAIKSI